MEKMKKILRGRKKTHSLVYTNQNNVYTESEYAVHMDYQDYDDIEYENKAVPRPSDWNTRTMEHLGPIPGAHKDRVRQRNVQRNSQSFPETIYRQNVEKPLGRCSSFVDMEAFLPANENLGPLVRNAILPREQPSLSPSGTITKYNLCCRIPALKKSQNYEEMFFLMTHNDIQTKRVVVEALQTRLLKTDPSRLLEFKKDLFFIHGPDILLKEVLKSLGDTHTLDILVPLVYSTIALSYISFVNDYIPEDMKNRIQSTYKKTCAELQTFQQSGKDIGEIGVLYEVIGQFLNMDIAIIFRVSDWASYFREKEQRQSFVSNFPRLSLMGQLCSIFLLGNLTFRRENRDDTGSLLLQLVDHLAKETGAKITSQRKYIVNLAVQILLNDPASNKEKIASPCLDIIHSIAEKYKDVPFSVELKSRIMYHQDIHVRRWMKKYPHIYELDIESATDAFITYTARNLQLEIDLCNKPNLIEKMPDWQMKSCYCLRSRARITILYPSKQCLQKGIMSDYKESVSDTNSRKWFTNDLDCLIRLHNNEEHKNIVSLLCYQCVPMPMFYVVRDDSSTNLLSYLTRKREENGRIRTQHLLDMCLQAIEAILFLHGKGMVHRDITSDSFRCVMRQDSMCVQLAVFRMAAQIWEEAEVPRRTKTDVQCDQIPTRWSAPESLLRGLFSVYSDIWMVGMLIWEIFNHGVWPFTEVQNTSLDDLMQNVVFYGQRPTDGYLPKPIHSIIMKCLDDSPDERIPLQEVSEQLKTFSTSKPTDILYQNIQDTWDNFKPEKNQLKISYQQKKNNMKPERGIPKSIKRYSHENDPDGEFYAEQNLNLMEKTTFSLAITTTDIHSYEEPIRDASEFTLNVKEVVSDEFIGNTFQHLKDLRTPYLREDVHLLKDENDENSLIYKCVPGVSLYQFVYDRSLGPNFMNYLNLIKKIAQQINDLHSNDWVIRCLRPQDVWVTREQHVFIPRLGAFRKLLDESDIYDQIIEPISQDLLHWSPPEVINNGFNSQAGDIWSFGMLVSQVCCILSIEEDYYSEEDTVELTSTPFSHVSDDQLYRHITGGSIPDKFDCCPEWLYNLLTECWETTRSKRPSINTIIQEIEQRINPGHIPLRDADDSSTSGYQEVYSAGALAPSRRRNRSHADENSTSSSDLSTGRIRRPRQKMSRKNVFDVNWNK